MATHRSGNAFNQSHILFYDSSRTIFLLDIPSSIADAQEFPRGYVKRLKSSAARELPFPSTAGEVRSCASSVACSSHTDLSVSIAEALSTIQECYASAKWCHERALPADGHEEACSVQDDFVRELAAFEQAWDDFDGSRTPTCTTTTLVTGHQSPRPNDHELISSTWDPLFENSSFVTLKLSVRPSKTSKANNVVFEFFVPPRSMLLLSSVQSSSILRSALRSSELSLRRFDLVLLDPPWPNASAKRKGGYEIGDDLHSVRRMLYGLDVDMLLKEEGYLAIWLTNKQAVRDFVLGRDKKQGWFSLLGLSIVEEWVWVKTTTKGECITSLTDEWRRPYETLLIAQAQPSTGVASEVKRRIIVAVPDLHSRKPCLKALFSQLLFENRTHVALEVFARYMVAGWWSWGLEALKYNSLLYWSDS